MSWATRIVESVVHNVGCLVRGEPRPGAFRRNPFTAQRHLLRHQAVRTIFDVGGNKGQTVLEYRGRFPEATIYSFEPFPDSYRQLTAACRGLPRVVTKPLAVCDRSGSRTFFSNDRATMNSVLPFDSAAGKFINPEKTATGTTIEVSATTLDEFCRDEGIPHVDILKMDIQGGELLALHGGARMFETQAVDLVFSEVLFAPMYANQGHFHELCAWLAARGYQLFGLYEQHFGPHQYLGWANAIFTSPQLTRKLTGAP